MVYNLLRNGVYWGYNPLTNLLLTSWDIQVIITIIKISPCCFPRWFRPMLVLLEAARWKCQNLRSPKRSQKIRERFGVKTREGWIFLFFVPKDSHGTNAIFTPLKTNGWIPKMMGLGKPVTGPCKHGVILGYPAVSFRGVYAFLNG